MYYDESVMNEGEGIEQQVDQVGIDRLGINNQQVDFEARVRSMTLTRNMPADNLLFSPMDY